MTDISLHARCQARIEKLNIAKGWQLTPQRQAVLLDAILPYIQQIDNPSDQEIATVAANFFDSGPMVYEMLAGNSPASNQLWAEWRLNIVGWAHRAGLSIDDAEDVTQITLVALQSALQSFRFQAKLDTFVASVYQNCYRMWLRKFVPRRQKETTLDGLPTSDEDTIIHEVADDTPAIADIWLAADIRARIVDEIQAVLESRDFQILYLYYVEKDYVDEDSSAVVKWTDEVIALHLQMTLNGVTTRRDRSIRRLAEALINRMGQARITELVGYDTYQILRLYYLEKRFTDEGSGRKRKWTDNEIGKQHSLTAATVKERRRAGLRHVAYVYLRDLFGAM